MTLNSIRARLLLFAAVMIMLALLASGLSIFYIFQRHVENRVQQELDKHFTQLVAAVEVQSDGSIKLTQSLADPRFILPLSGLYWQVDLDGKEVARSRSLWDQKLTVPTPPANAIETHVHELPGPDGQLLFSLEKAVFLEHRGKEKMFVVTVGLARDEINDTVLSLTKDVAPALSILGLVLLLATWMQISIGLKPLSIIEKAVLGIRESGRKRIDNVVADEVRPLVSELNALLAVNEERTRFARQRAANLAHGLRTPLTILGSLSRTVEDAGLREEAEKIRLQTEHMRQQVELELVNAMSAAEEAPSWISVRDGLLRLTKVVTMGGGVGNFSWVLDVPDEISVWLTRNDFNEIFGNLIENAQKWGKSQAKISLHEEEIVIEDDGPGVNEADFDKLTQRGFTTGSIKTSSGLGLSIVQQLTVKNHIALRFKNSELGGLAVTLQLSSQHLSSAISAAHNNDSSPRPRSEQLVVGLS